MFSDRQPQLVDLPLMRYLFEVESVISIEVFVQVLFVR